MEQDGPAHLVGIGAFHTHRIISQPHDLLSPIEPFRLEPWPVRSIDMRLLFSMISPYRASKTSVWAWAENLRGRNIGS
jgi:hypothetical protein